MSQYSTQEDGPKRVVALSNLFALCERASGFSRRYTVEKVSQHRVLVSLNDTWVRTDEYERQYVHHGPLKVWFPCFPSAWTNDRYRDLPNVRVVLEPVRFTGVPSEFIYDYYQEILDLLDQPVLWRSTPDSDDWQTESEMLAQKGATK